MNKKLKLETIVPKNLYIERKADKQLKQIIDDMSRPASILVARQMGKTNLLLNTKREFESDNVRFIYIDLSKVDNDVRDCFRYIIDTAIFTNMDIFGDIEDKINNLREKNRLPYREHELELEMLLNTFDGKIIIILDEIDSMKKFPFSDQFFSQIRSVYYSSRTNFPIFHNLTYILSGVLEPSEIIKDKNKSPFNISEKVYLNDFTKIQFDKFIKNISFEFFTNDITDRIYEWTNGHPRMIWNISSMLEEKFLEKNKISVNDVDDVINDLYIRHSDLPPIDHIKNLLLENHDIVHILLEMKQNILLNITDSIKNKLYLYGIIDITNDNSIKIKNKILEKVLSEDYLKSILYSGKSQFEIALDLYLKNEFSLALEEFTKTIRLDNITKSEKNYSHYYIGCCLFQHEKYKLAINSFDNCEFDIDTEVKMYYQKELDKGICYSFLKEYDKSLELYNKVLQFKDIRLQINAYINKATIHILNEKNENDINSNLDFAIELLFKNKNDLNKEYFQETLAKAYFNKASTAKRFKKDNIAIDFWKKILDINGIDYYKSNVYLELLTTDNSNVKQYLNDIHNLITQNTFKLSSKDDVISFSKYTIFTYTYELIKNKEFQLLNTFINYCQNTYDIFYSKCQLLNTCAEFFISDIKKSEAIYLYTLNSQIDTIVSKDCYRNIYINLVYIYYKKNDYLSLRSYSSKAIESIYETLKHEELDSNHYNILNIILEEFIKHRDILLAKDLYSKIERYFINNISQENIIYKAILLDKKYELSFDFNEKENISFECFSILKDNSKLLTTIHPSTRIYINKLQFKHCSYLLNNSNINIFVNTGRNDPCPCGSNKKAKNCCKKSI